MAAVGFGTFTACENDDRYDNVYTDGLCVVETPTTAVDSLYSATTPSATGIGTVQLNETDDIIEAYVTSSDEGGTFYKSISLQSIDGTRGFSVPVDLYNIYTEFEPGRKVYVHLNGRHINQTYGSLLIGDLYNDPDTPTLNQIGRLVPEEFRRTLKASCDKVDEDEIVQHMTIAQALNDNNINKLIEFDNVQFEDGAVNKTFYQENNAIGGATNVNLMDEYGRTIIFRTSSFAKFAGKKIPGGSGKVRGVLTKYRGDYQFLARTDRDVQLEGDRLEIDLSPPVGGTAITYSGAFIESFTPFAANQSVFPAYVNDPALGTRYWQVKTFGGNKYIQMTSFGGTPEANRTLFIVPVDMTAANNFSFATCSGFDNGSPLKVYYSMDYVPGANVNNATLVNITSSFTIPNGPTNGYATAFTPSGVYAIPAALTGNGYFIFEYNGNGSGGTTTTMQIDNITVN